MLLLAMIREICAAYRDQQIAWAAKYAKPDAIVRVDCDIYPESGWWVLSDAMGWAWWLGVYTRCPANQDLDIFPYCETDAPLPDFEPSFA